VRRIGAAAMPGRALYYGAFIIAHSQAAHHASCPKTGHRLGLSVRLKVFFSLEHAFSPQSPGRVHRGPHAHRKPGRLFGARFEPAWAQHWALRPVRALQRYRRISGTGDAPRQAYAGRSRGARAARNHPLRTPQSRHTPSPRSSCPPRTDLATRHRPATLVRTFSVGMSRRAQRSSRARFERHPRDLACSRGCGALEVSQE
jgi:hypothetical protein